jgi:hypothetical protein
MDAYPASHICKALKINDTVLKRWRLETLPMPSLIPAPLAAVVELPKESPSAEQARHGASTTGSISVELGDCMRVLSLTHRVSVITPNHCKERVSQV